MIEKATMADNADVISVEDLRAKLKRRRARNAPISDMEILMDHYDRLESHARELQAEILALKKEAWLGIRVVR